MKLFLLVICAFIIKGCLCQNYRFRKNPQFWIIHPDIVHVSDRFVDDMNIIARAFVNHSYVKTDVNQLILFMSNDLHGSEKRIEPDMFQAISNDTHVLQVKDEIRILRDILSTKLPPKRYMGLMYFMRALSPEATSKEVYDVIDYIHHPGKLPDYNITEFEAYLKQNCTIYTLTPSDFRVYVHIRPQVVDDIIDIKNTFSCTPFIHRVIFRVLYVTEAGLRAHREVIDLCTFSNFQKNRDRIVYRDIENFEDIEKTEYILATRLSKEKYNCFMDISRAIHPDAVNQNYIDAITYLYGYFDPPDYDCEPVPWYLSPFSKTY